MCMQAIVILRSLRIVDQEHSSRAQKSKTGVNTETSRTPIHQHYVEDKTERLGKVDVGRQRLAIKLRGVYFYEELPGKLFVVPLRLPFPA